MATIWAKQALTHIGWAEDVRIDIDTGGRIAAVDPGGRAGTPGSL